MKAVVLGTGRMGRRHIRVLRDLGIDILGVADISQTAREAAVNEFDMAPERAHADPVQLLEWSRPELVVVSTTAPDHCRLTCEAAKNGARYILCEKPMAVSLAECDEMLRVCAEHNTILAINHQMSFMEQYTVPRGIIYSDAFGGLKSMVVSAGNFGMCMNGTHYFEALRYMAGARPVEVSAWFSTDPVPNPRGSQFQDRGGSVRVTTENGIRFYLDAGTDQGYGIKAIYAGPYGQVYVDEGLGILQVNLRKAEDRVLPTTRMLTETETQSSRIACADAVQPTKALLRSLLNGGNFCTGEHGRLAVATVVAAYVSDQSGHRPVRVDEGLPHTRSFPWA